MLVKRLVKFLIAFIYKVKYIGKCKIHALSDTILGKCVFEGKNAVWQHSYFNNSYLGYGSYVGRNCEFKNCRIGRFCSIGMGVRVVSAAHPTEGLVSSHPAFYSNNPYFKRLFEYEGHVEYKEHLTTSNGYECEIGNDVWIGDEVLIRGGVTIGDGSIIGMGSIVTHDVEPYSIVAGVPARVKKKRFDDETIQKLMQIKWWNKSASWIKEHSSEFSDIGKFVESHYSEDKSEEI